MYTIRDMHSRRNREASEQEWRERSQNDPTVASNWHRLATEEKIKKRGLDEENQRKLEAQKLKNFGLLDVAETNKESAIEQQSLQNLGQIDERQMIETGATNRARMTNNLEREKRPFSRFTKLMELGQSTTPAGMSNDYVGNWKNFQDDSSLSQLGQPTNQNTESKYRPVKRYGKDRNLLGIDYYNSSDGTFAYFDAGKEKEESKKAGSNIGLQEAGNIGLQEDASFGFGVGNPNNLQNITETNTPEQVQTFDDWAAENPAAAHTPAIVKTFNMIKNMSSADKAAVRKRKKLAAQRAFTSTNPLLNSYR